MTDYERQVLVARAICSAAGHNPDQIVNPYEVLSTGAKGHALISQQPIPSWQLYLPEARAAIEACRVA